MTALITLQIGGTIDAASLVILGLLVGLFAVSAVFNTRWWSRVRG